MATQNIQSPDEFAGIAAQMADVFRNGGTLGDVRGLEDRDYEAIYATGHGLYGQGRYPDAAKVFGFLIMHNPYDRRFPMAMGSALQMQGQFNDAIAYYSLSSTLDMSDPLPTFHTAECLAALGDKADAREALGFVIDRASAPAQQALRQRAVAMRDLLATASDAGQA